MNRKDFLKRLGLGAAAAVVAPKVLADGLSQVSTKNVTKISDNIPSNIDLTEPEIYDEFVKQYPLTPEESFGSRIKYKSHYRDINGHRYYFNSHEWSLLNDPNLLG